MFLNGGLIEQIGKKKRTQISRVAYMAGFAGFSPALGSHISALLAKCYQFAIFSMSDTCNYHIED